MYWWAWGRYGHYKLTSLERGVGACLASHHRISPQSSPQVWVLCKSPMLQCLNLMFAFWYWFQFTSYKRKNEIFSTNNFEICCTALIFISTSDVVVHEYTYRGVCLRILKRHVSDSDQALSSSWPTFGTPSTVAKARAPLWYMGELLRQTCGNNDTGSINGHFNYWHMKCFLYQNLILQMHWNKFFDILKSNQYKQCKTKLY